MSPKLRVWLTGLLVCGTFAVLFAACEDGNTDVADVPAYSSSVNRADLKNGVTTTGASTSTTNAVLKVSPTTVSLSDNGDMAAFTASGGKEPYNWGVQDIFRGDVVDSGGAGAVYQRAAPGDNSVIVTDGNGDKAYAVVQQP